MEHNRSIRKYIIEASDMFRSSNQNGAAGYSISISNTYGMLIKDIGALIADVQSEK